MDCQRGVRDLLKLVQLLPHDQFVRLAMEQGAESSEEPQVFVDGLCGRAA